MQNKKTLRQILALIKPYMHYLIFSLIFSVISVASSLYAPILVGDAVDYIIGKEQVVFEEIMRIILWLAVLIAITGIAQWLMNLCNNTITYRVVRDVRTKAFAHLQKLPLRYVDSKPYGEIISRIITDVEQFSDGLLMGFSQLFTGVVTIVGTLVFMLTIDVKISLIVILITPVSLFVASFIAKRTYKMFKCQSESRADMTSLVEEMVGNQKVVQAFAYGDTATERFDEINKDLQKFSLRAIFFSSITNPSTRFVNGLVYSGVGIFGALSAMLTGGISVGQLSCFLSYANQYTKPFNEISGVVTELQNAFACARRVFDFLEEEPDVGDKEDAKSDICADGSLTLSDVAFSYRKDTKLLHDLNLRVQPGQKIAIVGPTGCGKTTLINLLMRFYDIDQGEIRIGDESIYHITKDNLRSQFGMVLQETWLKHATIAENIAYGKPDATREEIVEAAKRSYAHGFIKRMPQGYDTVISDEGGLSQGQKQLLCIARVMLMDPPMLILDEATSSIDTMTEIRVQKAFHKMMVGRTSFIVAHRLSTIREADVILVMKDGNIIEQGNHEELLKADGFYAELYYSQYL